MFSINLGCRRIVHFFIVILLVAFSPNTYGEDYLFYRGRTKYQIVLSPQASASEKTAAKELAYYLGRISGVEFKITSLQGGRNIFVGYNQNYAFPKIMPYDNLDESFTYYKNGHDLIIYGGRQRGTLYGVYTFLEKELGVRWYARNCTRIPKLKRYKLNSITHSESPAIKYRFTDYGMSNLAMRDNTEWRVHNKFNVGDPNANEFGGNHYIGHGHSFDTFVPASEFFKSHPEYFAMMNGKRIDKELCLTNPNVIRICKERLIKKIEDKPFYSVYSLSQSDGNYYCECDRCKRIEGRYGGTHSGVLIWFVNQIAAEVEKKYPDKLISTLAYHYTLEPPKGIKPADNVIIQMCTTGCRLHPLESECMPESAFFIRCFEGWEELGARIFIWDYALDFGNPYAPFPSFGSYAQNMKYYSNHRVEEVFCEGSYSPIASSFEELRSWVLAKLLWNPNQDTDALAKDFIFGYYGRAANNIWKYYRLCMSLVNDATHLQGRMSVRDNLDFYNDTFIEKSDIIIESAFDLAGSKEEADRVGEVNLQLLYLKSKRLNSRFYDNAATKRFESEKQRIIRIVDNKR